MPIIECDPWREQYFAHVPCPPDLIVPTDFALAGHRVRAARRRAEGVPGVQQADLQPARHGDRQSRGACIERERIAEAQSPRYVSRDVVGYEDLDAYGSWSTEPGYGAVWAPRITIGHWSPYRFGRWAWISPWGFTWIDDSPWGFAPFHYGRWAHLRDRWCWVPPRHHRPVWAPALVAWNGPPHLRGLRQGDLAQGNVSWLPLGPRDVYVPGHRASARYLRNVNVSNTTIARNADITNAARNRVRNGRFTNRDVPSALTTVPAAAFDADREPAAQSRLAAGGRIAVPRVPTDPKHWNYGVAAFERPPGKEPRVAGEVGRERRTVRAEPRQSSETRVPRPGLETRGGVPMARPNATSRDIPASRNPPAARSTPAPRHDSDADFSGPSNARESRAQSARRDSPTNRR